MMRHWHHTLSVLVAAPGPLAPDGGSGGFVLFDKEDFALCDDTFRRARVKFLLQIYKKRKKICRFGQKRTMHTFPLPVAADTRTFRKPLAAY